ncbi:MAG: amino acid permease C-terminal domain-containing protein, partial [bacterium]
RVPAPWLVCVSGALLCLYVMKGLPRQTWERFGIWLTIGLILYFSYGFKHSTLRRSRKAAAGDTPA